MDFGFGEEDEQDNSRVDRLEVGRHRGADSEPVYDFVVWLPEGNGDGGRSYAHTPVCFANGLHTIGRNESSVQSRIYQCIEATCNPSG